MSSYKPTGKILDNSWNAVERDSGSLAAIVVDPTVATQYDEATTDDIMDLYTNRLTNDLLYNMYTSSPFYDKYGTNYKKIEKNDMYDLYIYFRDKLHSNENNLNIVQIFVAIMEFFELPYEKMYKDIISIEDKSKLLETIENVYGHKAKLKCNRLF